VSVHGLAAERINGHLVCAAVCARDELIDHEQPAVSEFGKELSERGRYDALGNCVHDSTFNM